MLIPYRLRITTINTDMTRQSRTLSWLQSVPTKDAHEVNHLANYLRVLRSRYMSSKPLSDLSCRTILWIMIVHLQSILSTFTTTLLRSALSMLVMVCNLILLRPPKWPCHHKVFQGSQFLALAPINHEWHTSTHQVDSSQLRVSLTCLHQ